MAVTRTKHREEPSSYYNAVYKNAKANGGYDTDRYKEVYDCVMDWLTQLKSPVILECGCGTGDLAKRIIDAGYAYGGFDFSQEALDACPEYTKLMVRKLNAYDSNIWSTIGYNTVVAIETFEHLDDLRILQFIPVGVRVIFSVPDFSSRSHLRTYPDADSIREYYKGVLKVDVVVAKKTQADKTIFVCHATRI